MTIDLRGTAVTEDEARCLVTELNIGPGEEPDPTAVLDALDACGIDPFGIGTDTDTE